MRVSCPHCEREFENRTSEAGAVVQCPWCSESLSIPEGSGSSVDSGSCQPQIQPPLSRPTGKPSGWQMLRWGVVGLILLVALIQLFRGLIDPNTRSAAAEMFGGFFRAWCLPVPLFPALLHRGQARPSPRGGYQSRELLSGLDRAWMGAVLDLGINGPAAWISVRPLVAEARGVSAIRTTLVLVARQRRDAKAAVSGCNSRTSELRRWRVRIAPLE